MTAAVPVAPTLEFLARFDIELAAPLDVGVTPAGERRVIGIAGGHFAGPHLRGVVLPGGADWQVVLPDGTAVIDTRYTLRSAGGALISVATQGFRHGPAEVVTRLRAGEEVDPGDYYFRVLVRFETADQSCAWLNRTLVIASALRLPATVRYDAFAVR
ncbi:MAG: DUF3237 domain-containing protein [Acidimicrobiales bacterium]